jgi:DNA-binding transcriptional LysR family regulator
MHNCSLSISDLCRVTIQLHHQGAASAYNHQLFDEDGPVDLEAVRTFVAVADTGQFQEAAADLSITQQAASKRVARLEQDLGVQLFARTARGAELTFDGHAFLPHARELLRAEQRAVDAVRPGRRALRVDVIAPRGLTGHLVRELALARPEIDVDLVATFHYDDAIAALQDGSIDASFRAVARPGHRVPHELRAARVADERLDVLVSTEHDLGRARSITLGDLVGRRIWMPGAVPGTEWSAYYAELATTFGLTVETTGLDGGTEALLDVIAHSPGLATFVGERPRLVWPEGHGLRRIPIVDPTPVYPHSLLWRRDNPHPALRHLVEHLDTTRPRTTADSLWVPSWAGLR